MYTIDENGIIREMTQDEIDEISNNETVNEDSLSMEGLISLAAQVSDTQTQLFASDDSVTNYIKGASWQVGGLSATGSHVSSQYGVHTQYWVVVSKGAIIRCDTGYKISCLYRKDASSTPVSFSITPSTPMEVVSDGQVKIVLMKDPRAITSLADISHAFIYGRTNFNRQIAVTASYSNDNLTIVNHRGYQTIAPENTLPAFKLSKLRGFNYVETDIQFTSDDVPVLIHDTSIDRTSTGTGNVVEMTYEQLSAFDFGIWKSAMFKGTKIPTLDEFLLLCRNIGLNPFIEIKTKLTTSQAQTLINTAKRYNYIDKIIWIAFDETNLATIKTACPKANLGLLNKTQTQAAIDKMNALKTDTNKVYSVPYVDSTVMMTPEFRDLCIANDITVIWAGSTNQTLTQIDANDPYISGYLVDELCVNYQLCEKYL